KQMELVTAPPDFSRAPGEKLGDAISSLNRRFGKTAVFLGADLDDALPGAGRREKMLAFWDPLRSRGSVIGL
ncbi:MAG: hypothetical protein ACPLRM_00205, partial [Anaerolineae bacterium]